MDKQYYIYIMTNRSGTLYIGVTNDLVRRVYEHRMKLTREKQLKGWSRAKKLALIKTMNPQWNDLGAEWFGNERKEIPRAAPSE